MGIVNAYFPVERLRNFLTSRKLYGMQYLLASLFGAITPFCSCSSIPLFIGFVKGGIPLGVTFSFLITSPLVNEVAVAMFAGTFGWKVTTVYVVSGICLGMIGGYVLGKMKLEKHLSPWVQQMLQMNIIAQEEMEASQSSLIGQLPQIAKEALGIVRGVLLYVIIGIGIGAAIHGYVPSGFFEAYLSGEHWYAVPFGRRSCRSDVCQCRWHRTSRAGICSQRCCIGHSLGVHDVGSRPFLARSHHAQESDEHETHRHLLRHHCPVHHPVGMVV